ncbi:MAG: fatty acid desaturase [Proteobacteria bacterium]|nr:fatty acid desaturase [Pseudomonadota bacterium]
MRGKKINWPITLFLMLTPVVGISGAVMISLRGDLHWQTLLLAFIWLLATGLAITAGYHRLFAHETYQANKWVKLFFLIFGAAAFQGSALEWCTDHRNHHRYSETEKDPYNIRKGFWYAHIGWLMVLDGDQRDYGNVNDLAVDRWVHWQHKHFGWLSCLFGFIVPMLIAGAWGDWLGGLIFAGVLRTVINHHFTFCINSVCHLFGKRQYSYQQTGRDNWFTALFTYGEGFHNFHHQFPLDYRNGIRFYHYDPTKWLIWLLSRLGLAHDLQKISVARLTRYRLKTDEQALLTKFKQSSDALLAYVHEYLVPLRDQILQVAARIEALEKYGKIKEYRNQLKAARLELKYSLIVWSKLTKARLLQRHESLII